jgi:hypothetical protein
MMTRKTRWLVIFAAVAIVYLMLAYILLPSLWTHQEHEPVVDGTKRTNPPEILPPPLISLKDRIWHGVSNAVTQ